MPKLRSFDQQIDDDDSGNSAHIDPKRQFFERLPPLKSLRNMVDKQLILDSVGPVQAVLDAHDGVVNVVDTTDGVIMISLEGGCTGCSATPMTAMQIYYSLMKLDQVEDVVFVNGELPAYMRSFIDDKLNSE
jgi:Fe-S cluster biogenesis protein NfuA